MGAFMSCDMRALFDRLISEGAIDAGFAVDNSSKKYADYGTVIHYELQDGLRCVWPDGVSANHKWTKDQATVASELFYNDTDRMIAAARRTAKYAAGYVPKAPDGQPWLAEHKFSGKHFSGTLDFLSQDHSVVGDLKTTSRPPKEDKIKYPHLIQMMCYSILTGAKKGWVLYVDAQGASWAMTVQIDFTTAPMIDLRNQVIAYAKYLRSAQLVKTAVPRMGDHCSDNFCPYRTRCRDQYQPLAGVRHEVKMPVPEGVINPFKKFGAATHATA